MGKDENKKVVPNEKEEVSEELHNSENILKNMISNLNELPTDVLEQLLKNLDKIEEYNRNHKDEDFDIDNDEDDLDE